MMGWKSDTGQRIDKLYAWVAEEPDGGEGVVGVQVPGVGWMPLVGADKDRMESLRQHAINTAQQTGYPVRLKMFAAGVVIDQIDRHD